MAETNGILGGLKKIGAGIGSLVYESGDEDESSNSSTTDPLPAPSTNVSFSSTPPISGMSQERINELDTRFKSFLQNQMDGVGSVLIKELNDNLDTLTDAIPDEGLRIKAALKIMIKRGHSLQSILGDFDKRLLVLDESKKTIESKSASDLAQKIGEKEQLVKNLDATMKERGAQVQSLQTEIQNLAVQKSQEEVNIKTERTKVEQGQSRFVVVFSETRNKTQSDRDKIAKCSEGI